MLHLSVVIVSYKATQFLPRCLRSLAEHVDVEYEVIIVENNSGEDLSFLAKKFPNVRIIYNNTNAGFGRGCNQGAQKAKGTYLFFLNPDTEIQSGIISTILKKMDEDSQIGSVGLALMKESGRIQPHQYGSKPTLHNIFRQPFTAPLKPLAPSEDLIWSPVDWVSGGAFLCSKQRFEKMGYFDERYFLYFEDTDLGIRFKKFGYQNYWTNMVRVFHEEGGTQQQYFKTQQYYNRSQRKYFRKHFGIWTSFVLYPFHWLLLLRLRLKGF